MINPAVDEVDATPESRTEVYDRYPVDVTLPEPICTKGWFVLFIETPLKITATLLAQEGTPVNSKDVPEVEFCAVPDTILELTPLTATVPVPEGKVSVPVPATAGTVNEIAPDVSPEITTELIVLPQRFFFYLFDIFELHLCENVILDQTGSNNIVSREFESSKRTHMHGNIEEFEYTRHIVLFLI
mgnify:CR=1 FL=1